MTRAFLYGPIILVFVFTLIVPCLATAGDAPPDDIKKAAREGINVLLKGRQADVRLHNLGFESQADIDSAELGEGFQIFTIDPNKLLDESASQDVQDLVIPTSEWLFLVQAGGKANSLLKVSFLDGKWTHVGIGSSRLAKELSGFLAAWPASSGYQYRFIRVYQAASDFIELSQGGKVIGIISLTSLRVDKKGRKPGEFTPHDLRDPKEVLSDLRPAVKMNIEMYKQIKKK